MSDCGVCLYGECDETSDEMETKTLVSDGTVKCSECYKLVPTGAEYEQVLLIFGDPEDVPEGEESDVRVDEYKTCLVCAEIATAFYCDGRVFGGALWESMGEVIGELNTACFDKLKTPAAKAELQRRWMEHKEIA